MTDFARWYSDGIARGGPGPFLTFYAPDERVELSYATFDNWVCKTANRLVDGEGLSAGATALVPSVLHWHVVVQAFGVWLAGLTLVGADADFSFAVGAEFADEVRAHGDRFSPQAGAPIPPLPDWAVTRADRLLLTELPPLLVAACVAFDRGAGLVVVDGVDPTRVAAQEKVTLVVSGDGVAPYAG